MTRDREMEILIGDESARLIIPDDISDEEVMAWLKTKPTVSYYTVPKNYVFLTEDRREDSAG